MITIARRHGVTTWETLVDRSRPSEEHFAAMDLHQGATDPEFAELELHTEAYEAREFTVPPEPEPEPEPEFSADALASFDAGPTGEPITLAQVIAGSVGPLTWTQSATPPAFFTSPDTRPLIKPAHVAGALRNDPSIGSLSVGHNQNDCAHFDARWPAAVDQVSVSGHFKSTLPGTTDANWANYDLPILYSANGQDFLVLQWKHGQVRAHGKRNPAGGPFINVLKNKWYFLCMRWLRSGLGQVALYDADTLAMVGISEVPIGDNPCCGIKIGLDNHGQTWNGITLFDNLLIDWTEAKHPLGI